MKNAMLEDSLRWMKEFANIAKEYAVDKQKAVDCAIQQAEHARITAETLRKTAEDTEKVEEKLQFQELILHIREH